MDFIVYPNEILIYINTIMATIAAYLNLFIAIFRRLTACQSQSQLTH